MTIYEALDHTWLEEMEKKSDEYLLFEKWILFC